MQCARVVSGRDKPLMGLGLWTFVNYKIVKTYPCKSPPKKFFSRMHPAYDRVFISWNVLGIQKHFFFILGTDWTRKLFHKLCRFPLQLVPFHLIWQAAVHSAVQLDFLMLIPDLSFFISEKCAPPNYFMHISCYCYMQSGCEKKGNNNLLTERMHIMASSFPVDFSPALRTQRTTVTVAKVFI